MTRLAGCFELVGVDLSEQQLRLAGANVPDATLVHGDFAELEFSAEGFNAETNRRLIREARLELVLDELVWMREPHGDIAFLRVLARKRSR
jgi:ubiquinone/menaquinone biosynthesis C-methylase UbiE